MDSPRSRGLTQREIMRNFVVELRGIDLARHVWTENLLTEISETMNRYGLVILPGQNLSDEQLLSFVGKFGEVAMTRGNEARKKVAPPGVAEISNLGPDGELLPPQDPTQQFSYGNRLWHADLSFTDHGAAQSVLLAREVPATGGETEFADTAGAYDELSAELKEKLEGLEVLHSLRYSRAKAGYQASEDNLGGVLPPIYRHSFVGIHPDSGRRSLCIGSHAGAIKGMSAEEGSALLDELLDRCTRPEHVYIHRWAVGDIVMWDNRTVLHRRGGEYDPNQRRSMRRATLLGALNGALEIKAGVQIAAHV